MTILPRDANENVHVVGFEFVRRQIFFERFFGFELLVELITLGDQNVGVICPRCSANQRERPYQQGGAKQTDSIHKKYSSQAGDWVRAVNARFPTSGLSREKQVTAQRLPGAVR